MLKVTDPSQKWKIALIVIGLLLMVWLGFSLSGREVVVGGVSFNNPQYGTSEITSSTVSCPVNGLGSFLDASTGRTSFEARNSTSNGAVALCKGTSCSTAGFRFLWPSATTTIGDRDYTQDDGYTGAYSCRSVAHNTGTLDIEYSQ